MWSASLRYLFSLLMMAVLVWQKGELNKLPAIARTVDLVALEYASVSSLLCAYRWLHLWRIMVCGCDLADMICWSPSDPTFWTKDLWYS